MRVLVPINLALLALAAYAAARGFGLVWQVSLLPLGLAAAGALLGLAPTRPTAAINATLGVAGGFALLVAAVLAVLAGFFHFMGGSPDATTSLTDASLLFALGVLALVSGCAASRRMIRARPAE